MRDSLGSDSLNPGKIAGLTIFALLLATFPWFTANATLDAQVTATFYTSLALIAGFVILLDQVIVKRRGAKVRGADIPDTVTYEDETFLFGKIPGSLKAGLVIGSLLLGGWIFVNIGGQPTLQLVGAPTFGLIDIGPTGSAFLSGAAGIVEDVFFFGFLGPTIAGIVIALTGIRLLGTAIAWGATPFIFMLYHVGRYGEVFQALDAVLLFGFFAMTITILLSNLLPVHAVHFANNAGLTFFANNAVNVSGLFFVYVFIVLIAAGAYFALRRRR